MIVFAEAAPTPPVVSTIFLTVSLLSSFVFNKVTLDTSHVFFRSVKMISNVHRNCSVVLLEFVLLVWIVQNNTDCPHRTMPALEDRPSAGVVTWGKFVVKEIIPHLRELVQRNFLTFTIRQ